ncbi:response regulator transcription factor [Tatumella sp. UBA2305]|uniref:response regulator transcription factor n=1 Tax=Tatumella sp. UBA2305 TaxID=1947647 RepID=UPI0025F9B3BB|nr:response regulator [Tatumella sp. UBA2305]
MDKTVYLVDDDESVVTSLQNLLSSEGYDISAFTSPSDFLNLAEYKTPGCLIVDLNMPGLDGFEVNVYLTERGHSIPTIFLTGHGTIPITVRAMKAGAFEFLTKPVMPDELIRVIEDALKLSEKSAHLSREKLEITGRYHTLTPREKELMKFIIRGLLNKQIAAEMGISEITAKVHKRRVMEKMMVRSVPELVRMSEKLGLTDDN